MDKRIIVSFAMCVALGAFQNAKAQTSDIVKERFITESAICTMEDYEACSILNDAENYSTFMSLFSNENVSVYNDLLGISSEKTLSIKEYAEKNKKEVKTALIRISNMRKERIWKDGTSWKIEMSFDKSMSYTNSCDAHFSTNDIYKTDIKETAILTYNEQTQKCLIEKIDGSVDCDNKIADDFYVFLKTSDKDNSLKYLGKDGKLKPLYFNDYDQAYLTNGVEGHSFTYPDADVIITSIIDDECRTVQMEYAPRKWRTKLHYGIPIGSYDISTSTDKISAKGNSTEVGIDLGYGFYANQSIKMSLFSGLRLSSSTFDMNLESLDYSYVSDQDIDGDTYRRHYDNMWGAETRKISKFVIPIYVDTEFVLSSAFSVYVQAGILNNFKLSDSKEINLHAENVYGEYSSPEYGNITLDHRWGYNNFVQNEIWKEANASESVTDSYAMNVFGGIGCRIRPISTMPLYLDLGLNMLFSNNDVFSNKNEVDMANGLVDYRIDIEGSSNSEMGHDLVHGISDAVNSVKCQPMKFSIGLMYKF